MDPSIMFPYPGNDKTYINRALQGGGTAPGCLGDLGYFTCTSGHLGIRVASNLLESSIIYLSKTFGLQSAYFPPVSDLAGRSTCGRRFP
jgi:hypothetical protein